MANYTVKITFLEDSTGSVDYDLPHIQHVSDPQQGIKATVIPGIRGDGSIIIPGGKKSQEIIVRGKLFDNDGYKDLTALMTEMRTKLTTEVATLTMKHYDSGWVTDWQYIVRRIEEIRFPKSMRTESQDFEVSFLVLAYS